MTYWIDRLAPLIEGKTKPEALAILINTPEFRDNGQLMTWLTKPGTRAWEQLQALGKFKLKE